MKTNFVLLVFVVTASHIYAQTPSFEWAKSMGGTTFENGKDIAQDNTGNVITVGNFQGTADFDPGSGVFNLVTGSTSVAGFVQKLDANGNFIWAKRIGDNGCDVSSVAVDQSGNIYITGSFSGVEDFDPGPGSYTMTASFDDIYVLKLDNSGNFVWAVQMSGDLGDEEARGIVLDGDDNVFITGRFEQTVDFDPGGGTFNQTASGNFDAFVEKLDANGNFIWAKTFGGPESESALVVAYDGATGVYVTGSFRNTVDFNPGSGVNNLVSNGNGDIFIQKLDTSGNFQWARSMGSTGFDVGAGMITDTSGNVITTGFFRETVDFDPGAGTVNLISNGANDVFIQKLDANGNLQWAKSVGGTGGEIGEDVNIDVFGDIYITGYFGGGSVDFDPGIGVSSVTSAGNSDAFILKLQENGDFSWVSTFGGVENENCWASSIGDNGVIYTTGTYRGTADFDHTTGTFTLSALGNNDIYVHKMGLCSPTMGTDVQSACSSYTWIDGNTYTSSNNTATWSLTNAAGCDSIVTLDLTIGDFDPPVADIATLSDITTECEVTSLTPPTATDNCSGSVSGTHNASLPITS